MRRGQVAEAVRDHRGEQAQWTAHGPEALDCRALTLDVGLLRGEGLLQPAQDVLDVAGFVEGGPHVVQADAGLGHLADPQQADHVVVAVAAASVSAALGLRQQADLVVVTNGARGGSGEGGGIADLDLAGRHGGGVHRRQALSCCGVLDDTTCRYGTCNYTPPGSRCGINSSYGSFRRMPAVGAMFHRRARTRTGSGRCAG